MQLSGFYRTHRLNVVRNFLVPPLMAKNWRKSVNILLLLNMIAWTTANTVNAQGITLMDNKLQISLSDEVQEALNSGVNLTFIAVAAKKEQLFFLSWTNPHSQQTFKIHKHALSNHYLVHSSKLSKPRNFSTLRMSLEYVTQLNNAFFKQVTEQSAISGFKPTFRVYLDKFSLPVPMRINAFWSGGWDLDSDWQE